MFDKAKSTEWVGFSEIGGLLRWHNSGRAWRTVLEPEGLALFVVGIAGFATSLLELSLWGRSSSWFLPTLGHPTVLVILALATIPSSLLGAIVYSHRVGPEAPAQGWVYVSGIPLLGPLLIAWNEARDLPNQIRVSSDEIKKDKTGRFWNTGRWIHEWVQTFPGPFVLALAMVHSAQALGWVVWVLERANSDPHVLTLGIFTAVLFHALIFVGSTIALGRQRPLDFGGGIFAVRRGLPWLSWLPMPLLFGYFVIWWWFQERDRTLMTKVHQQRWRGRKPEVELPRSFQPASCVGIESRFFRIAILRLIIGVGELFSASYAFFFWTSISVDRVQPFILVAWLGMLFTMVAGIVPLIPWRIGRLARWTAASLGLLGTVVYWAAYVFVESAAEVLQLASQTLLIASMAGMLAFCAGAWSLGNAVAASRAGAFLLCVLGCVTSSLASVDADFSVALILGIAYMGWVPSVFFALWALRQRREGDPIWPVGLPGSYLILPFLAAGRGGTRRLRMYKDRASRSSPFVQIF